MHDIFKFFTWTFIITNYFFLTRFRYAYCFVLTLIFYREHRHKITIEISSSESITNTYFCLYYWITIIINDSPCIYRKSTITLLFHFLRMIYSISNRNLFFYGIIISCRKHYRQFFTSIITRNVAYRDNSVKIIK